MKSYRKSVQRKKIKSLGILITFLIIPLILNTPLFMFNYNNSIQENDEQDVSDKINLTPKINAPQNDHYFRYFKVITVDPTKVAGTGSYTDFPMLISIYDSDLRIDVQSSGNDIAFSNGTDWLDHEIEVFNRNYNNTHAQLITWVRIPSLSTSVDTIIYMYYGNSTMTSRQNPTGVWESDYQGVWHLKEDPSEISPQVMDSTSNGNDGTSGGSMSSSDQVSSKINGGIEFDGIDDYISFPDPLDSNKMTVSAWIFSTRLDQSWHTIAQRNNDLDNWYDWQFYARAQDSPSQYRAVVRINFDEDYVADEEAESDIVLSTNTWYYLVGTYDQNQMKFYRDGSLTDTYADTRNIPDSNRDIWIARNSVWNEAFEGIIDEFRISSIDRSSGWINTEFNNQKDPDSFYSISYANRVSVLSFNDFKFFKEISFDHTKIFGSGSYDNFPVLISLLDSDLRIETDVQSSGNDIAFTDGITWLDHEIELFNQTYNGTHAHLVAWVRIPSLSTSEDTTIRMYYGNPTMVTQEYPRRVWNSDYVAVWHMNQDPSSSNISDSTSNNYDLNTLGFSSDSRIYDGKVETTTQVDGINDRFGVSGITGPINDMSFQTWFSPDTTITSGSPRMTFFQGNTPSRSPEMIFSTSGTVEVYLEVTSDSEEGSYGNTNFWGANNWFQFIYSRSRSLSQASHYINGALDETDGSSDNANQHLSWNRLSILATPEGSEVWGSGKISEFRILKVPLSAGRIATEYNNQNDPDSFYSIGNATKVIDDVPSNTADFNFYKDIIIDHTMVSGEGYHSNFPMLINLTDSDLRNDVQSDGDDIAFSIRNKWLDHEIELFNQSYSPTHAHLVAWVRIPKLSTSLNTIIRMHYGNPTMSSQENSTGVWDAKYMGVWHLSESSGFALDSTSYDEDGTVLGVTQGMDGQIDGAYDFNLDERVTVGNPSDGHLDFGTNSFTVSCWIDVEQSTSNNQIPVYKGGTSAGTTGYSFVTSPDGQWMWPVISDGLGNQVKNEYSISFDTWIYYVMVIDRTSDLIKSYKSGSLIDQDDISSVGSVSNSYGLTFSHSTYDFDGLLDEIRITNVIRSADWIKTEYYNQYNPNGFYSTGSERSTNKTSYSQLQINAVDLYGNPIPNVNISIYNHTNLIESDIANTNGSVLFANVVQTEYNFTVTMDSNISPFFTILVNETSNAISINESYQNLNLSCNVSRNIFYVEDIDGVPLDSGWIIVGNSSDALQNCTIDASGKAVFRWLNITGYNYTVWYRDNNYNPKEISVGSGDILTQNSQINITATLTTVNFTIWTIDGSQPVNGVKMILNNNATTDNIINLTSNQNGKATLRWVNSSALGANYSLTMRFYGAPKRFNMSMRSTELKYHIDFSVKANASYDIWIELTTLEVEDYATALVSLNPADYIEIDWGSQLKLMGLFNVTKAVGAPQLLGPTYADSMSYQITLAGNSVKSGTMPMDLSDVGRHYTYINTDELESDAIYVITISAFKSGFTIPSDLIIILNILENEVILNQSQNDDSAQSIYWSEDVDMSVKAYGKKSESFTYEEDIIKSEDHWFNFSIPDLSTDWNLSRIVFNVYNITFGVDEANINITITDDYGKKYIFTSLNSSYYYYNSTTPNGRWIDLELNLNKRSVSENNTFNFIFDGTFVGTIDVVSHIYLLRDKINVQYSKFNITNDIPIFAAPEGWVINYIAFEIYNCYNTSTWTQVNLSDLSSLNITTNEGFKKSLDQGYSNGTGLLIIDNRVIYPLQDQFLFTIDHNMNLVFDVNISVEYVQEFYKNQYLESFNSSIIQQNISNGGNFVVSSSENSWIVDYSTLSITGIYDGIDYFFPSELAMNITIGGLKYSVSDTLFGGSFSLDSYSIDKIYTAKIETTQPVNFSLSFMMSYSRMRTYEIRGTVTYQIKENPKINGTVQYLEHLGCYSQIIDTALIDVDDYTVNFIFVKNHYLQTTKDFTLIVMNRLTLLNGSTDYFRVFDEIYALETINYTFSYIDSQTSQPITNLQQQSFVWEKYNEEGQVVKIDSGNLVTKGDFYVLDLNTEKLTLGEYLVIINLDKDNYDYKVGLIYLTISERPTLLNGSFTLGTIFDEININTAKNYSYSYNDYLNSTTITNLLNQSYSYTSTSQDDPSGQGTLYFSSSDSLYILDLDTETKSNGTYTILIVLGKENYTTQTTTLVLKIISNVPLIPVELEVLNSTTNLKLPVYTISKYWNTTFSLTLRFAELNSSLPITDATVSFNWECGSGNILPDNTKGPGYYSFVFNTGNSSDIGTYTVDFIARKEFYAIGTPNPNFIINIINRPTELNSSRRILYMHQKLYVKDDFNFKFEYFDILTSQLITGAEDLSFVLQKLDVNGDPIEEETVIGSLYESEDKYIL
ncbi:MAG: DUF2341 domain-containing protein, partial [Promethearchaeota archaeon]